MSKKRKHTNDREKNKLLPDTANMEPIIDILAFVSSQPLKTTQQIDL